jgi:dTDP-4-amino-4,6-dideoxygalactose transaminase
MHLALRELGIGPGDEVIASSLTFIASISPAAYLGATPVFMDSDRATWNMDPDLLAAELADCAARGALPKAVVPTDLYGQCADLPRIIAICEPYGVPVVADCAEAMGARLGQQGRSPNGRPSALSHAGTGARAAVYSFNGNKIITTGGGGMLCSEDAGLIEHARKLSTQAREPVPYYQHTEIGYNYRMSNILAAIGRGQLSVLDERVRRRRAIFEHYRRMLGDLPGLDFMPEAPYGVSNRWLTVILLDPDAFGATPEDIRLALEARNIESRPVWKPMHLQPVFGECRFRSAVPGASASRPGGRGHAGSTGVAVSEDLFRRALCLPSGTAMTDGDVERVAGVVRSTRKA